MFNKATKGPAPLGNSNGKSAAPVSTSNGKSRLVGNIVAYKKDEQTGEEFRQEIAVLFSKDGRTISSIAGKRDSDFDGISFFLNMGTKDEPKRLVLDDK